MFPLLHTGYIIATFNRTVCVSGTDLNTYVVDARSDNTCTLENTKFWH
jgi:hypothetical protein